MYLKLRIVVALLGLSVASSTATASPVEQVVKLLSELKDKTVNDGKSEQQIYDKYACWCETTTKRKADDIDKARADLRALGQRILKLKGTVATRSSEIAQLNSDIQDNENEQESLTAVRQKQNGAWAAKSDEVKQALGALQQAIKVLSDATTGKKKKSALIQENEQVRMKYAVNNVLEKLPSTIGLPPARMALLSEFTSAAEGYAPQSATIQGMLGDMYLTFAANLESDTLEEANRNADYEKVYAGLEKENNNFKATRDKKETEKAEAEALLADTTKAYEDTEKQMNADIEFFGKTKDACMSKHEEFEERVKMRDNEIEGIEKALEILTSDEARKTFADAIKPGVGFLQIASDDSNGAPATRAYNALKTQVKKFHSMRLAALAVSVRSAKAGHFDKVIKDIDLMLKTLDEEGQEDLDKKTQCLDEYQKINKEVSDLDWKLKNNKAKIAKLDGLIELRQTQKAETVKKIKETLEYIKTIKKTRKTEHDAYNQAKKDDNAALKLLQNAKKVFEKFYKKNVALIGEPEFARSKDAAPDATFSSKGNNAGKTKGILALMDYIIEDVTDELANSKAAEAKSQAEFESELKTAEELVDDLKEKKTNLKGLIAKRTTDKKEENKDKKENTQDRDGELKYQAKIKPDCDWILKAFDGRADARAAEAAGLTQAKEFLAGKTALIQSAKKFDDSKFQSIGFLGLSH